MGFRPLSVACMLLCLALVSCDSNTNARLVGSGESPATEATGQELGSIQLRVELGAPGFLARAQAVRPYRIERLVFRLFKLGDDLPTELETIDVSDPFSFSRSLNLDVRFQWRVELQALDSSGEVRYEGGRSFQPKLRESTSLDITLYPKEYELRLKLLAFEGMSRVEVTVGMYDFFSWSIDSSVRNGDSITLSHEFSSSSSSYLVPSDSFMRVRMSIYGSYLGSQRELFSCDTNLYVRYGQDSIARLKLKWARSESWFNPLQSTYVYSSVLEKPLDIGVEYPMDFLPIGDSGYFKDYRDGHIYEFKRFGELAWMTQDLHYNCENCGAYGANVSNPDYVAIACPIGWRIPDESDWQNLVDYASLGGDSKIGVSHLMAWGWYAQERICGYEYPPDYTGEEDVIWVCGEPRDAWYWDPVRGDDSIGFHLNPTGRTDWTFGRVIESHDYSEMWSRWSGGMSIVSFDNGWYGFNRNTMDIGTAPGIRCVAD